MTAMCECEKIILNHFFAGRPPPGENILVRLLINKTNSIDGALITYYNAVTLLGPIQEYIHHRIYNEEHGLQMFISRTCFPLIIVDVTGHPNYGVDSIRNNLAIVTVSS